MNQNPFQHLEAVVTDGDPVIAAVPAASLAAMEFSVAGTKPTDLAAMLAYISGFVATMPLPEGASVRSLSVRRGEGVMTALLLVEVN